MAKTLKATVTNNALRFILEKHNDTLAGIKTGLIERRFKMVVVLCNLLEKNLIDLENREVIYN